MHKPKLPAHPTIGKKFRRQLPTYAEVRERMLGQMTPEVVIAITSEEDPPFSGVLREKVEDDQL